MSSKEEILSDQLERYLLKPKDIYHGTDAVKVSIERAMEEYAKEVAIDYTVWVRENWLYTERRMFWNPKTNRFAGPEELFNFYLQSKNK